MILRPQSRSWCALGHVPGAPTSFGRPRAKLTLSDKIQLEGIVDIPVGSDRRCLPRALASLR